MTTTVHLAAAAFLIDLAKDEEAQAEQARKLPHVPGASVVLWRRARARKLRAAAALLTILGPAPAVAGTGVSNGPTPHP